jgi:membrane protein YqaA with SNARE-associated domain
MKKPPIKRMAARRAAKTTAKHTAHGAVSKLKREPIRAVTLLTIGSIAGALAGWLLTRESSRAAPQ